MGTPTRQAKGEVLFTASIYKYYADTVAELLKDQPLHSNTPGSAVVRRTPIGPILGIMPWNYPYCQVARPRRSHSLNRRTRKSLKEVWEAVSDRVRAVRSRGERPPARGAPKHRR
jgi:Aldehyde dehydrogenase family